MQQLAYIIFFIVGMTVFTVQAFDSQDMIEMVVTLPELESREMQKNLELLGDIEYSEYEINYANTILKETGKEPLGIDGKIKPIKPTMPAQGGSTDVGDVSQVVPVVRLGVTAAAKGGPWHSWAVVACTGMSIGHKGLIFASKALAMTMLDFYKNPNMIDDVKKEYLERKGDRIYKPRIPPGPPKLID